MKLTILERPTALTAGDFQARLEKELEELKGALNAFITLDGFSRSGWTQINITGEDSEIMTELIARRFSLAHTELREIETSGNYAAEIIGSNGRGLKFDVGFDAGSLDCVIPTRNLNVQLADGKTTPLRQLMECYCLYPGVRVSVRVTTQNDHGIEGWLSDSYVDTLADWVKMGVDRIQVFECFKQEVEYAVLKARLSRDVIAINSLTFTAHSMVCKLGTDAVGLIPKLGHLLRKRTLKPFQPKKIVEECRPW
ncbi:MAG TPA: DUF2110 family protein [Candidatus Dormibacteraeota bacterium]|nr:DUF2110 family protein [Candidatus Dormibacteraeota bacterium]